MGSNVRARGGGFVYAVNPVVHSRVAQPDQFNGTKLRIRSSHTIVGSRHCPWVRKVRTPIFAILVFCCIFAPTALLFSASGTKVREAKTQEYLPGSASANAMQRATKASENAKTFEHQLVNLIPPQCVGSADSNFVPVVPHNNDARGIHQWLPQVHEIPRSRANDSTLAYVQAKIKLIKQNTKGVSFGGYSAVPILIRPNSVMAVIDENAEVVAMREVPGRLWGIHFLNSYLLAGITTNRDTSHMYDSDSHIILWDLRDGSLHDVKVFGCHHDFHYNSLRRSFFAIHQKMVELECSDETGQSMTGEPPGQPLEVLRYNAHRTKIQAQCVANTMMRGQPQHPADIADAAAMGRLGRERDALLSREDVDMMGRMGRDRVMHPQQMDDPRENLMMMRAREMERRRGMDARESRIGSRFQPKQRPLLHDDIHEMDSTGKLIWDYNTLDGVLLNTTLAPGLRPPSHFSASQVRGIFHRPDKVFSQSGVLFDAVHSNGIDYDGDNEILLFSSRHMDTIYCIDRKTRQMLWAVGRMSRLTHYNLKGEEIVSPVYGSHGVQYLGKDSLGRYQFITFDNDLMNFDRCWSKHVGTTNETTGDPRAMKVQEVISPPNATNTAPRLGNSRPPPFGTSARGCNTNHRTRLVQIAVDVDKNEARELWEWFKDESSFARVVGGGSRILPNGNVIGSFGRDTHRPIVEVDKRSGEIVWQIEVSMSFVYFVSRFADRPGVRVDHCVTPKTSAFEFKVWNSYPDSSATLGRLDIESTCPPCAGESGEKLGSLDFYFRPKWIETALGVKVTGPRRYGGLIFRIWNEDGLSYSILVNRTCSCAGEGEGHQSQIDDTLPSVDGNNDVEAPKPWKWSELDGVTVGVSYKPPSHVVNALTESGRKIIVNGNKVTAQSHWWDQAPALDPRVADGGGGVDDKMMEMRMKARESIIARRRQENEERLNRIREERARRRG